MASIPKTLCCTRCSRDFPTKRELTEHISSSCRCPSLECRLASSSCFTEEGLYLHMKVYHEHMVCTFCKKTFESPVAKRQHDRTGSFKCTICPLLDLCRREALEAHLRGSWQHAKTWCKACCTNFDDSEQLRLHTCHPVDRRRSMPLHSCKECGLFDLTARGLEEHDYWHHDWTYSYNEEVHFDACRSKPPPTAKTRPEARAKPPPKPSTKTPVAPNVPLATRDLYEVLGVNSSSSSQEIRKAAKQRRIDCHPDKLKTLDMSTAELKEIDDWAKEVGGAAEVLLDPRKRAQYDWRRRTSLRRS